MARFRKKAGAVEAVRFDGSLASAQHIIDLVSATQNVGLVSWDRFPETRANLTICSLTTLKLGAGDWLVRGEGGFYVCAEDYFDATYEPAD